MTLQKFPVIYYPVNSTPIYFTVNIIARKNTEFRIGTRFKIVTLRAGHRHKCGGSGRVTWEWKWIRQRRIRRLRYFSSFHSQIWRDRIFYGSNPLFAFSLLLLLPLCLPFRSIFSHMHCFLFDSRLSPGTQETLGSFGFIWEKVFLNWCTSLYSGRIMLSQDKA